MRAGVDVVDEQEVAGESVHLGRPLAHSPGESQRSPVCSSEPLGRGLDQDRPGEGVSQPGRDGVGLPVERDLDDIAERESTGRSEPSSLMDTGPRGSPPVAVAVAIVALSRSQVVPRVEEDQDDIDPVAGDLDIRWEQVEEQ